MASLNRVLDRLHGENLDGRALIDQGILQVAPWSETYLLGGYFDSDRMLGDCTNIINRCSSAGTQRLLLAGEKAWCASGLPGCERIIHYEAAMDKLLRDFLWVTAVCQYSLSDIQAAVIYDNLCLHRYAKTTDRLVTGLNPRLEF